MKETDELGSLPTEYFSKIQDIAERFEGAWGSQNESSRGVDLGSFLPKLGDPLRMPALVELVKTDMACRYARSLPVVLETYLEKFPELGKADDLPASLIFEEYRVRTTHGVPTPLQTYKDRFPRQFPDVEKLIQADRTQRPRSSPPGSMPAATTPSPSATPTSTPPAPGVVAEGAIVGGHYRLSRRIGRGGFGEVWLGTDTHGNIEKAIKIITRSADSEEAQLELRAMEIMKKLNYPYLLRNEGFFAENDRFIIVMELADCSLRDVLKKAKKETGSGVPAKQALSYMKHAADALDYLHEEGVFHRDIKPENILLVGRIAKVADFGLARIAQNRQSTAASFAGTGLYSAPETWKSRVTAKSDQYSLAVTYAELRLARNVFKGTTLYEFMVEHLNAQPNLDPIPPAEQEVVLRAMAKEPDERYANCVEFIQELERAVAGGGAALGARGGDADGAASLKAGPTARPDSKNRPKSAPPLGSVKPTTTRPGSDPGTTSPAWNATKEAAQPTSRRRRKKSALPMVLGALLLAVVGVGAFAFLSYRSLDEQVKKLAGDRQYSQALAAVDASGPWLSPFRDGLRSTVRTQAHEAAEKAASDGKLDDLDAVARAGLDAFAQDEKLSATLDKAYGKHVDEQVRQSRFADAFARVQALPASVKSRATLLKRVRDPWVEKAWVALEGQRYDEARDAAAEVASRDAADEEADSLKKLALACLNNDRLIRDGRFAEALKNLPRKHAPRVPQLAKKLEETLRGAWVVQGQALLDAKDYESAQSTFASLLEAFPNEASAKTGLTAAVEGAVGPLVAKRSFEAALDAVARAKVDLPEIERTLRSQWRADVGKRFEAGPFAEKEAALASLDKLVDRYPGDVEARVDARKFKTQFADACLAKAEGHRSSKEYAEAAATLAKAEAILPSSDLRAKTLRLRLRLDDPVRRPDDAKTIAELLPLVSEKDANLVDLAKGVVRFAKNDKAFQQSVDADYRRLVRAIPSKDRPSDLPDSLVTATSVTPVVDGAAKKLLALAQTQVDKKEVAAALQSLGQFDQLKDSDTTLARERYRLYATLGEQGHLDRGVVRDLAKAGASYPQYALLVRKAMTAALAKDGAKWPEGSDSWEERLKDCAQADADAPIVAALRLEGRLETKAPVTAKEVDDLCTAEPSAADKPYVDYVAARGLGSIKRQRDAAALVENLSAKDPWLAPQRKSAVATLLQDAALALSATPEGGRQSYKTPRDAGMAYRWLNKSTELAPTAAPRFETQWALAVAAGQKDAPDLAQCAKLGAALLGNDRKKLETADVLALVLAHPLAFEAEVRKLRDDLEIGVDELKSPLASSKSHLQAQPTRADLKKRHATLLGLRAWVLERTQNPPWDEIRLALGEAKDLDPDAPGLAIDFGRIDASSAIAEAEKEPTVRTKVGLWRGALKRTDPIYAAAPTEQDGWVEFCIQRSQLALNLGNYLDQEQEEFKSFLAKARDYAEAAVKAIEIREKSGKPHPKRAVAQVALGNSLEDLAHFAAVDPDKNFAAARVAFQSATKTEVTASLSRGRAAFRWATSEKAVEGKAKKNELFADALVDLASAQRRLSEKGQTRALHLSETHHFVGMCHAMTKEWAKGSKAHIACLATSPIDNPYWGTQSFEWAFYCLEQELPTRLEAALPDVRELEMALKPFEADAGFKDVPGRMKDFWAYTHWTIAKGYKDSSPKKAREQFDLALERKHRFKAHDIAADRAFFLFEKKDALGATKADLLAAWDALIEATETVRNLQNRETAVQKLRERRKELETSLK